MRDPFPVASPAWLQKATTPLANYLSLPTLPYHIHELLFATLFYHFVQTRVSPWLSPKLSSHYRKLSARTQFNWDVHVVSFVQSVVVCAMALYVMYHDEERRQMNWQGRVWGYTGATGLIEAFGCGYFLWDLIVTATNYRMYGFGTLAHAISALTVFSFGFRPFVNYYAPDFVLYELSSPFLNIHWFCDKLDLTGSNIQLVNGIFLLSSFFLCRLCWGTYASISVFRDCLKALLYNRAGGYAATGGFNNTMPLGSEPVSEVMMFAGDRVAPGWLLASYAISNLTLNLLNWYWIRQMVATIRKRFPPPWGTMKVEKKSEIKDLDVGRGVYADGHKSLEVNATQVRKRPVNERTLTGGSDMMSF